MLRIRKRQTRFVGLAVCCLLLLVQPFRYMWMSLLLPKPWAQADVTHLFRIVMEAQDFPVDKTPIKKDVVWREVQVDLTKMKNYVKAQEKTYPEFRTKFKQTQSEGKEEDTETKVLTQFQPLLNYTERALLMFAFDTFHRACEKAGLTYFMIEASLMGVIRHHGLIPWDDDIDVAMSVKEWRKIRDVLGNIEGFELFAQKTRHWKFYSNSASPFETEYHKFPYIDIFFYDEDETYIWAVSKYLKHDLLFKKSDIFPLHIRPFEDRMVPVPCNLDLVVHQSHDKDVCVTPEFIHKTNAHCSSSKTAVHCQELYKHYPFVFETRGSSDGAVQEELWVDQRKIHTFKVPTVCRPSEQRAVQLE